MYSVGGPINGKKYSALTPTCCLALPLGERSIVNKTPRPKSVSLLKKNYFFKLYK